MYKITTKDGKVYWASKVETAMGFVSMENWDCERRIPSGEVQEIRSAGLDDKKNSAAFLLIVFIVVFLVAYSFFEEVWPST